MVGMTLNHRFAHSETSWLWTTKTYNTLQWSFELRKCQSSIFQLTSSFCRQFISFLLHLNFPHLFSTDVKSILVSNSPCTVYYFILSLFQMISQFKALFVFFLPFYCPQIFFHTYYLSISFLLFLSNKVWLLRVVHTCI